MHILIAGAGGPLGRELVDRFLRLDWRVTALAYSIKKFTGWIHPRLTLRAGNVTRPYQIEGLCQGVDVVLSCIGITRMGNHQMTHHEVDYLGNLNLLREAERAGVRKFAFVTPVGAERGAQRGIPLLDAKYQFKNELRRSSLEWLIFRSGAFYPDLAEWGRMAGSGPLAIIGPGTHYSTPIDVGELATLMANDLPEHRNEVIEYGGPENLSWNDIGRIFREQLGRPTRVRHIPIGLCRTLLPLIKPFSHAYHAQGQLILFMFTHDLPTPHRGQLRFAEYLKMNETPSQSARHLQNL